VTSLYARELLDQMLAKKELKILETVSDDEDVEKLIKELIESIDDV